MQDARVFTLRGYYEAEGIEIPADWEAVVKREKSIGGIEYGFTLISVALSNNPEFYKDEEAKRNAAPVLAAGDYVDVEGKLFKITNLNNNNFGLEEIKTIPVTMAVL
jgi:hypothetical protein